VSRAIALQLGYGRGAATSIAIGNISVDLRHWNRYCAHGMTSMDPHTGEPTLGLPDAQEDWRRWIELNVNRARQELEPGADCHIGHYYLGMALHAIQDREAHAGMTNAEHAKRYLNRTDPDLDGAALARGRLVTHKFLAGFAAAGPGGIRNCKCGAANAYSMLIHPPDRARMDMDALGFLRQAVKWLQRDPPVVRWPSADGEAAGTHG
jgi:hypothetical protein